MSQVPLEKNKQKTQTEIYSWQKKNKIFPTKTMLKLTQNIKLCFCISIAVTSAPVHPYKAKAIESYTFDWAV